MRLEMITENNENEAELIIEKFKEKFNSDILEIVKKNQKRIIITINPDSITKCC